MAQAEEAAGIRLSAAEIGRIERAAAALEEYRRALVDGRGGILAEIAPAGCGLASWRHYPEEEIYDPHTHAQYFFHVHPPDGRPAVEYGHFHVFLRAEGMPPGVAPFHLPEAAVANVQTPPPQGAPLRRGVREEVCHLIAIAVDRRGEPIRLFTTNRWVTGETWYRAEDVIRMLDGFSLSDSGRAPMLSGWVGAAVALFRPQIAALLRERDTKALAWRRQRRTNVFEDHRLEITSSRNVDRGAQLVLIENARSRLAAEARSRLPALPPMAEGWGEGPGG